MLSNDPKFDTPTIPASTATVIFHTTLRISASAALVFRTVRNTETWKDWNKYTPKVTITVQPPDEDHATNAEAADVVRRTSIALHHDADMTEALDGRAPRPVEEKDFDPNWHGRRPSLANSESSQPPADSQAAIAAQAVANVAQGTNTTTSPPPEPNGGRRHSSLLAAPAPIPQNSSSSRPTTPSSQLHSKQKQAAINAVYGEPSVRIQLNTHLTFHNRIKLPTSLESKVSNVIVTEVLRPDDAVEAAQGPMLKRSKTHMKSVTSVYRIVWRSEERILGKTVLLAERVVEIRPILGGNMTGPTGPTGGLAGMSDAPGDGGECEVRTWENQKGIRAQKGKAGEYVQHWGFEVWAAGLRGFCESMGGSVDRRDFSVS